MSLKSTLYEIGEVKSMRKLCIFAIIALVLTGITACKKTSSKNAVVTKTNEENSVKKIASVAKKGTAVKIITSRRMGGKIS